MPVDGLLLEDRDELLGPVDQLEPGQRIVSNNRTAAMLSDTHPAKITGVSAGIRVAYVLPSISISLQHARLFPRLEYALTGFQPVHDTFNDAIGFGVAKQNNLFVFLLISLNQAVYH